MCGRYAFDDIEEIFEVRTILEEAAANVGAEKAAQIKTAEVFPTDTAALIAQNVGATAMQWGYPLSGTSKTIINARSETIFDKPMFRKSIESKKCLVPCTGFFEWKKQGSGKQKYKIYPAGEKFFYLAGLYSAFAKDGIYTNRFVIITAPANEAMRDIHERMPLIVLRDGADEWLGSSIDIEAIYKRISKLDKIAV